MLDLRNIENGKKLSTEFCIIGAGAAGSVLALELQKAGKSVILLESGDFQFNQKTQELYDLEFAGMPFRQNFINRLRAYGGTCNLWTGRALPYQNIDFVKRPWVNLSSWPFSISELVPFYQRAIPYLGLPKYENFNFEVWKPGLSVSERALLQSPSLSTSVSLWGRQDARFGIGSRVQKELFQSKTTQVVLGANLVDIKLYPELGRVKEVAFQSLNGKALSVKAKTFIFACGGLENARILLNANHQLPNGLGNPYDNVGRYFMDHPKFEGGVIELNQPARLNHMSGRLLLSGKVRLGLALSERVQRAEKLLNPYLTLTPYFLASPPKHDRLITMAEDQQISVRAKPHFQKLVRQYLSNFVKPPSSIQFKLTNYLEQEPNRESRVYLSDKKDALGKNKLILDWKTGDKELKSIQALHEYLGLWLEKMNLGKFVHRVDFSKKIYLSDASHHMGTTRMSERAEDGVVDKNCKIFDLENLYIAGSSVFPTSGHANPTFTIIAMAIRLAAYLKSEH